jgi:ribonucleoside-diphosphate reductase alpha chain
LHISISPEHDYEEVQVFSDLGKGGDVVGADLEGIGRLVSTALRGGIKIEKIIGQLDGIGSTIASAPSRAGKIASLPHAFATALKKFVLVRDEVGIENLLMGRYDQKIWERISDKIRTGKKELEKVGKKASATKASHGYELACPECGNGKIIHEDGCEHCDTCDFVRC